MATFEIELTRGYKAIVDECDADLNQLKWYAHIGKTGRVYARRSVWANGCKHHVWLHRVIYSRSIGALFTLDETIDHIDNNPLNNTRENLRPATSIQNLYNAGTQKRQLEKGRLKGARYHKRDKAWTSAIKVDGKLKHLGTFKTMEEAHVAYCDAAKEYRGEFMRAA